MFGFWNEWQYSMCSEIALTTAEYIAIFIVFFGKIIVNPEAVAATQRATHGCMRSQDK